MPMSLGVSNNKNTMQVKQVRITGVIIFNTETS